ncbi:FYVE zinc finger/3'5'-cyclic nucleotide phosphodiesterase, putative [Leishmania lindenbergi]|uniref:FYVE zinc finger/3'5'-cyclic nucleotide phosphodiesterase n=1 Tax=Leishmania lindenbergi TaxID=651832 RepID=A0AAW3A4F9_9TRYP
MSLMPGHPVPRSQWVESAEACAACGKRFSFFTSKENCPCCGRLFCSSCLSAQCTLFPMAAPKAVCLDCFRKTQDWRLSQLEQHAALTPADVGAASLPLSTSTEALELKLKALDEEFDRTKADTRRLREENDTLIDLLTAKDTCIAELTEELMKAVASADAAAQSAEKLQLQLRDERDQRESTARQLEEAEQRAASAAQASEAMNAQIQEHMQAKVEWEASAVKLQSAVRKAEDMSVQSAEELSELRAAMKTMNTYSEEKIKQLTAQLQSIVEASTHLQKDYDRNVESLRAAEQSRIASDAAHDKELQRLREDLSKATSALAQAQERYERQQISAPKITDDAAAVDGVEKQREIATLKEQLASSSAAQRHLQGELDRAVEEALRLREDGALKAEAAMALVSELRTQLNAQRTAVQQDLPREQEANARLRADLAEKERLVTKLRRGCFEAATAVRAGLGDLRGKLVETKLSYEEGLRSWQTWLSELRAAVEAALQQQALISAAASPSDIAALPHVPAATKSRWAQDTIVEELQYVSVSNVNVGTIAPVPGLEKWEFDTVAEAQRGGEADVLMRIGHQIALNLNLFPDRASQHRWVCLLATVQANYRANPYHNRVHAADVMQGVYALICRCPGLLAHMTTVEKRAVVFAAAVHDIRHPGRSEMFLRNTFDAMYMRYNASQVLEQMHTATAFHLLATPELDFTHGDMSDTEALEFHGLVAALIGCTFMGRHASLMEQWSRPLQEGKTYDVTVAADRQQTLSLFLHAADIGAQARGLAVAPKWLGIVEEMRAQGDEEAARGLPPSPGSSRSASLERGQLFFMEMFVVPLFDLVHQVFPSIESPMRNLRALHAHYCAALQETREFPPPVQYRTATKPVSNTVETTRTEALDAREAALKKREKALKQATQRLREATATVADRERQVGEKEAAVMRAETSVSTHRNERRSVPSSIDEEKLLRATTAVIAREARVERGVANVEKMTAALEEREAIASRLTEQLATIAEKVNQRRQLLRYREARVRGLEAALRAERLGNVSSEDYITGLASCPLVKPVTTATRFDRVSPPAVVVVKLESALEKLTSALRYM